jgi:outer membrane protein OmpA-like peptidoglycan-associated protein
MKTAHAARPLMLVLLLASANSAQTPPKMADSSHQPPSPLKVPDAEALPGEPVLMKLDTITVQLDTSLKAHDSTIVRTDAAPKAGDSTILPNDTVPKTSDADGDSVPDSLDHCLGTPRGLSVDKSGCLVMTQLNRRLVLHVTYFPGTTKPDPYTLSILDDLILRLKDSSRIGVTVEGFTDNIGEDSANGVVSQKRADKIKAYLVKKGIAESRIEAIGRGESKFIADNATASGRRKNRRIEISFHQAE